MRPGEVVSLQRMKAWWTYTEIRSPRLTEEYQVDPRVPPLLAKVGSVAFKSLSALEIDALAEIANRHLCYVLNKTTARAYAFPIFALIGGRIARVVWKELVEPIIQERSFPSRFNARGELAMFGS